MKGESTLSDFFEYTILDPGFFAPYIGFHENEVRSFPAMSEFKSLGYLLKLDCAGLWEAIKALTAGERVLVDYSHFQNDTVRFC